MFDNIGGKLRGLAKLILLVGLVISVIGMIGVWITGGGLSGRGGGLTVTPRPSAAMPRTPSTTSTPFAVWARSEEEGPSRRNDEALGNRGCGGGLNCLIGGRAGCDRSHGLRRHPDCCLMPVA